MFQGFLLPSQFEQLEKLQDKQNPNFLQEIFSLYFKDTIRQFAEIEKIIFLEPTSKQKEDMICFFTDSREV